MREGYHIFLSELMECHLRLNILGTALISVQMAQISVFFIGTELRDRMLDRLVPFA